MISTWLLSTASHAKATCYLRWLVSMITALRSNRLALLMKTKPPNPALQEADIQDLRRRLIDQGRFTEDYLGADALHALRKPDDVSPVLMEVLQASARMDVPNAARHRIWELYDPSPHLLHTVIVGTAGTTQAANCSQRGLT